MPYQYVCVLTLVQSCGKFMFSLTGMNNREFVLRSILRLYLERHLPPTSYVVSVKLDSTTEDGNTALAVVQEISAEVNGYVEIDVGDIFRPAVKKGRTKVITCWFPLGTSVKFSNIFKPVVKNKQNK